MEGRGPSAALLVFRARQGGLSKMLSARPLRTLIAAVAIATWAAAAEAGDPASGRALASACSACHGLDGLSRRPDAPSIAGQVAFYMIDQLKKYRSGARTHPVMNIVAEGLSDEDIADLVAYYSGIKITVEIPE